MFSLESPHQGDSNKYTQETIFIIKKQITNLKVNPNTIMSAAIGFFVRDSRTSSKLVNESSVFNPFKFYGM